MAENREHRSARTIPCEAGDWRTAELPEVLELLDQVGLPNADLTAEHCRHFFALGPAGAPWAIGGLELYRPEALLRSVAVRSSHRRCGLATTLVARLEGEARRLGLHRLTLLTTDAVAFFAKCGYRAVERADLPARLQSAPQVAELCPSSATVMRKPL